MQYFCETESKKMNETVLRWADFLAGILRIQVWIPWHRLGCTGNCDDMASEVHTALFSSVLGVRIHAANWQCKTTQCWTNRMQQNPDDVKEW